ncbi:MAG: hypothetical protein IJY28_08315, partial [Clostridia bacterium]|nr:hypothetical protein [Clostridia bacterium]
QQTPGKCTVPTGGNLPPGIYARQQTPGKCTVPTGGNLPPGIYARQQTPGKCTVPTGGKLPPLLRGLFRHRKILNLTALTAEASIL